MSDDIRRLSELRERLTGAQVKRAIIEAGQAYSEIAPSDDPRRFSEVELERYADSIANLAVECDLAIGKRSFLALVFKGPAPINGRSAGDVLKGLEEVSEKGGYLEMKPLLKKLSRRLAIARCTRLVKSILLVTAAGLLIMEANDLSGRDLAGRDFGSQNLSGRDLSHSKLANANFWLTTLANADLEKADLAGANLYFAKLEGANLRGAKLAGADLRNAELSGADLTDADLSGAYIDNANFSGAILDRVRFDGAVGSASFRGARVNGTTLPSQ